MLRVISGLIVIMVILSGVQLWANIVTHNDRTAFSEMCKTMGGVPVLGLDQSNVCLREDAIKAQ